MEARVTTYGNDLTSDGLRTVQHWQLKIDGEFLADTSSPNRAKWFLTIADAINRGSQDE